MLFWGIVHVFILWLLDNLTWRDLFVISSTNWFVISYVCLLLFSEMINNYIENNSKRGIGMFLTCFFAYQTWFGWFPALPHFDVFQGGYSFVSFVFIYVLARYMRIYGIPAFMLKYNLPMYIAISLLLGFSAYLSVSYSIPVTDYIFKYNNPLVILSAACFFFSFYKWHVPSLRCVNYFASSTLSVLLIHGPQPAHAYIKKQFEWLRDYSECADGGGGKMLILWVLSIAVVYFGCILLDQIRILVYKTIVNTKNNE